MDKIHRHEPYKSRLIATTNPHNHVRVGSPLHSKPDVMKVNAATERKIIRWFHILASIPIVGYIYGPVSTIPEAVTMVRWVILPAIILSGLWLWKGYAVKRWLR